MVESVERRFGLINKLPKPIEWLSDNGPPYTAGETRALARDIGLKPCTTPIQSPQSNGMAEAFVKTIKRDYARVSTCTDAASVLRQLDGWFEHYNAVHPHKALGLPLATRVQAKVGGDDDQERGRLGKRGRWSSQLACCNPPSKSISHSGRSPPAVRSGRLWAASGPPVLMTANEAICKDLLDDDLRVAILRLVQQKQIRRLTRWPSTNSRCAPKTRSIRGRGERTEQKKTETPMLELLRAPGWRIPV